MKNNEFFKALKGKKNATTGECQAYRAWQDGIREKLDFPFLKDSLWERDIADFLATIEKAGFRKFGFFSMSAVGLRNLVDFAKAGWEIAEIFQIPSPLEEYGYRPEEGLLLEKKN